MNKALRLVLPALCWALACLVPMTAQASDMLRVGAYPNNKPWEFYDSAGQLVGFDIDMVEAIGHRLNMRLDFMPMPFRDLFASLAEGRIDVAVSSITITSERAGRFDFSQAYYRTSQGIVAMKGTDIRSLADLKGQRVTAEAGSTNEQWLTANRERYGFGPTVASEGIDQALALLQTGKVDAYFGDLPALLYQLLKRPDLAVIARLPTDDSYGLLLARGSPLTTRLDDALGAIKKDGTLAKIHEKWFGSQPEPGSPVTTVLKRP